MSEPVQYVTFPVACLKVGVPGSYLPAILIKVLVCHMANEKSD
ncbi:MAG: hypothetical protein JWL62_3561 [Hyphomicrobiales bacterium]|nr:hypothetical protein [Hyphomicrobiales bacterium]